MQETCSLSPEEAAGGYEYRLREVKQMVLPQHFINDEQQRIAGAIVAIAVAAKDGVEAVEQFTKYRDSIRFCVLDIIMPRKSGKETCEEILKQHPGIKVIFFSGYTADKIQYETLPAGASSFRSRSRRRFC